MLLLPPMAGYFRQLTMKTVSAGFAQRKRQWLKEVSFSQHFVDTRFNHLDRQRARR